MARPCCTAHRPLSPCSLATARGLRRRPASPWSTTCAPTTCGQAGKAPRWSRLSCSARAFAAAAICRHLADGVREYRRHLQHHLCRGGRPDCLRHRARQCADRPVGGAGRRRAVRRRRRHRQRGRRGEAVVARYLDKPFFAKPGPKSLDRSDFTLAEAGGLELADGARTLAAVSAAAILKSVELLPSRQSCGSSAAAAARTRISSATCAKARKGRRRGHPGGGCRAARRFHRGRGLGLSGGALAERPAADLSDRRRDARRRRRAGCWCGLEVESQWQKQVNTATSPATRVPDMSTPSTD